MLELEFHRYRKDLVDGRLKVAAASEGLSTPNHEETASLIPDEKIDAREKLPWDFESRDVVQDHGPGA